MASTRSFIKAVLLTGLIAGILDLILGIFGHYFLVNGRLPENMSIYMKNVLRYISSAAFGKGWGNDTTMEVAGLLFHFFIALSFAWFYFLIYPNVRLLQKSIALSSILYGLFVWAVMNMVVVPLSALRGPVIPPDYRKAALQALVLIVCIGFPVAARAHNFYKRNR
ncbi:MAG: hypothetical protein ABIR18_05975 [Chitinophagaceae bacterium]